MHPPKMLQETCKEPVSFSTLRIVLDIYSRYL